MGPQRYPRMKKALAGLGVNRLVGPTDVYVLRLSTKRTPARAHCAAQA